MTRSSAQEVPKSGGDGSIMLCYTSSLFHDVSISTFFLNHRKILNVDYRYYLYRNSEAETEDDNVMASGQSSEVEDGNNHTNDESSDGEVATDFRCEGKELLKSR